MPELLQVAFLCAAVYGFYGLHRIADAARDGKFHNNVNHIKNAQFNQCEIKQEATDAP